jgi:hypothetical protein
MRPRPDRAIGTYFSPAKWHAAIWSACPCGSSTGSCSEQIPGARAIGHRVWNRHPEGGLTGDGISPFNRIGARARSTAGSGTGIELSSARV